LRNPDLAEMPGDDFAEIMERVVATASP
jgi:hypothetical protein